MNSFTRTALNSMNTTRTWNYTIDIPKIPTTQKNNYDKNLYILVPTGECSLDGRVYKAIEKKEFDNYSKNDKDRLNLMI